MAGEIDTSFVEMFFAEEADSPGSQPEGTDLAIAVAAIQALRDRRSARRVAPTDGAGRSAWFDAGLREAHGSRRGG